MSEQTSKNPNSFVTSKARIFKIGDVELTIPVGVDQHDLLNDAAMFTAVARGLWSAKGSLTSAISAASESVDSAQIYMLEMAQEMIAAAHDAHFSTNGAASG